MVADHLRHASAAHRELNLCRSRLVTVAPRACAVDNGGCDCRSEETRSRLLQPQQSRPHPIVHSSSIILTSLHLSSTCVKAMSILQKLTKPFIDLSVMTWDFGLFLANLILPAHPPNQVIAAGLPGHAGKWPDYVPPGEGDSRSACPMLNAMCAS